MSGQMNIPIQQRLDSHLIPVKELASGGYEGLNDDSKREKIRKDFKTFMLKRAQLVCKAMEKLAKGEHISMNTAKEE